MGDVYSAQAQQWLTNNYPNFHAGDPFGRPKKSWGIRLIWFLAAVEVLFAASCLAAQKWIVQGHEPLRFTALALALLGIPVIVAYVAWLLAPALRLPWGDRCTPLGTSRPIPSQTSLSIRARTAAGR
jgi:hypothetical protein